MFHKIINTVDIYNLMSENIESLINCKMRFAWNHKSQKQKSRKNQMPFRINRCDPLRPKNDYKLNHRPSADVKHSLFAGQHARSVEFDRIHCESIILRIAGREAYPWELLGKNRKFCGNRARRAQKVTDKESALSTLTTEGELKKSISRTYK